MKLNLLCVGRLGQAFEAKLATDYALRATSEGRRSNLGPVEIVEILPRKPGKAAENEALLDAARNARLIACDRSGAMLSSRDFATLLGRLRDDGVRRLAFLVGGADGLESQVLSAAFHRMSFGPQTWPHALARVMLAEQIYRAATILAGGPYHRE
ncbi:MAG TPA: 23S rRNA (pseudouridine(1915)-N(3))-methyltransferase RlmH [Caulobacteraceae bacterium]